MIFAFIAAGVGNLIRMKLIKHHYTLFLNIAVSISAACLTYAVCLHMAELLLHVSAVHEAGYICSMLFIIPGFPFITSGIDLAKLDYCSGCNGVCMDHGTFVKASATGFCSFASRKYDASGFTSDRKFLRSIWILDYV